MWKDEIVEEIHRIRDAYAKSFNYDMDAICADLRKKEAESGREIVDFSKKHESLAVSEGNHSTVSEENCTAAQPESNY